MRPHTGKKIVDLLRIGVAEVNPMQVWAGHTRVAASASRLRLNRATTARGLSLHPVSRALRERLAMAGPDAPGGGTVQILGRLGYGPDVDPTPCWRLDDELI
ncbi:hypothetical protein [Thetidibacter halocola]|uniref:Uncharacterized protein n=1 Tax=Thetidibacter halocola TaxID=2827239 RepID=A0A8J7WD97_9RHOB|nr:hypothetical protein [Thetidibacter halocola]MBS0125465.1 hypothetical protein [Thetidibacter halocola]